MLYFFSNSFILHYVHIIIVVLLEVNNCPFSYPTTQRPHSTYMYMWAFIINQNQRTFMCLGGVIAVVESLRSQRITETALYTCIMCMYVHVLLWRSFKKTIIYSTYRLQLGRVCVAWRITETNIEIVKNLERFFKVYIYICRAI